jgi:uncharacterized membrane protein
VYRALAAIMLVGAAARFYHLDHQSLWHDEALSLIVARSDLEHMVDFFRSTDNRPPFENTPPLYFLLLHGWFKLFGFGVLEARFLSVAAGVLALPLIFMLAERLYGTSTGLCAALLLAISQLGVMLSQEARHYEVFLVLFLVTAMLYWISMTRRSLAAWSGCTIAAILLVGTQYYGVFAIAALAIFTLLYWRSIPLPWVAGTAAVNLTALLPWFVFALESQVRAVSSSAQPEYFAARWSSVAGTINRFNNGAVNGVIEAAPVWTFFVGALIFGGPLLLMLSRAWSGSRNCGPEERRATVFTSLLWMVPLASVVSLGLFFGVQFNVRYAAFCIAPYYILTAAGLVRLRMRSVRMVTLAALVCYGAVALRANYNIPYKENYRDAIYFVTAHAQADDCYAFVPFGRPPLEWSIYAPYMPGVLLGPDRNPPPEAGCARIWVLTYQRVFTEAHERWREWLSVAAADHDRLVERRFFWVRVELYVRE